MRADERLMSFESKKPPNPPRFQELSPIRGRVHGVRNLLHIHPAFPQIGDDFALLIFNAKNEFDACLINSALLIVVTKNSAFGPQGSQFGASGSEITLQGSAS